jgi:predicted nucleic acid-binding Zn ribbon protein
MNRRKDPEKIGSIVENILAERGYLTICKEYEVVEAWPRIAGERLARVTECRNVENGILYVKVFTASWRQEITYFKRQLIKRIHEETGCTSIREIVFC